MKSIWELNKIVESLIDKIPVLPVKTQKQVSENSLFLLFTDTYSLAYFHYSIPYPPLTAS
jgi:hypothetical protein